MPEIQHVTVRGPILPFRVDLDIEGFTLINWELPAYRLARWLPEGLELAEREADYGHVAYLSVFVGRNVFRRVGGVPALPLRLPQLNYRTYVRTATGRALYIFRSIVGVHPLGRGLRLLPGLSGDAQEFRFEIGDEDDESLHLEARVGPDGRELSLALDAEPGLPAIRGFDDPGEAVRYLGDVQEALYPRGEGVLGLMRSQHPPLVPWAGTLRDARFDWLVERGILTPLEARYPLCTFVQRLARFPVFV